MNNHALTLKNKAQLFKCILVLAIVLSFNVCQNRHGYLQLLFKCKILALDNLIYSKSTTKSSIYCINVNIVKISFVNLYICFSSDIPKGILQRVNKPCQTLSNLVKPQKPWSSQIMCSRGLLSYNAKLYNRQIPGN